MDYQLEVRKFVSSQYLYTGFRVTAGVIIPAMILYRYDVLAATIAIPLGALFTSLTDLAGPPHHRRTGMIISIALNSLLIIVTGLSRSSHWFIGAEIIGFGIFFSMIGIYGARANSIGLLALIVFILNVDRQYANPHIFQQALFYLYGGAWYATLSILLYKIRPYRPLQQLLGECLMEIAVYFRARSDFYQPDSNPNAILTGLREDQVRIHHLQEQLREMIFSTRRFVSESTAKGRALLMMFLDSVDLLERIMTSPQDFVLLHRVFETTSMMQKLQQYILHLSNTLHNIGLAVQEGKPYNDHPETEKTLQAITEYFQELRQSLMNPSNVEAFIRARQILYTLQDISNRIHRMTANTRLDQPARKADASGVDVSRFAPKSNINFQLLRSNISFHSPSFRHALRLTLALLTGYLISLLFPLGHGYWIMLTIATIIKPGYTLSRNRNVQRLTGTFTGAAVGFAVLFLHPNDTVAFLVMLLTMVIAYSFLKLNYGIFTCCLTIFLFLAFHFLDPAEIKKLLTDRVLDTAIGSVIAYGFTLFVLPVWEHSQMNELISKSIQSFRQYFNTVASSFAGQPAEINTFKFIRKEAFIALANLSDTLQRMLSEPKSQQPHLKEFHQFVSANHTLASHIASLSYYAQHTGEKHASKDFIPMIKAIDNRFGRLLKLQQQGIAESPSEPLPVIRKVNDLLERRKKDLESGVDTTPVQIRQALSELKTTADQFILINSTLKDIAGIVTRMQ